ncbi:MAG TPA: hypothetical protein VMH40_17815 [Myxococcaceae bacterium]|nr:hypothetical protein [Myxococcaceae bacterium]
MLHLFHLGPLLVGERRVWLLSGVNEQGGFTHPFLVEDLAAGLEAIVAREGVEQLRVEPALAEVAGPLRVRSEPLPKRALVPRAVLAFAFASSHRLFRRPSVVAALLEACAVFEKTAPWRRFGPEQPFAMLVTERWRCWTREFAVLGSAGEPRGLELQARPGVVARARRRLRGAVDSLLLTFESGPSWAMDAVRAGYGLRELPTLIPMNPGSGRLPETLELLQLAAALRCAALLGEDEATAEHGAHVQLAADGCEITTLATPPGGHGAGTSRPVGAPRRMLSTAS